MKKPKEPVARKASERRAPHPTDRRRTETRGRTGARTPNAEEPAARTAPDPFTVMRVVLPASQKAFVYERARTQGLETPSHFVRGLLQQLQKKA